MDTTANAQKADQHSGPAGWCVVEFPQGGRDQPGEFRPVHPEVMPAKIHRHRRIPTGLEVQGAILSDQVRNMDWRARQVKVISPAPDLVVNEVLARIYTILEYDD